MEDLPAIEALQAAYRRAYIHYRQDDEVEVRTENHLRLSGVMERICSCFGHPVRVLDAGCGTGRYFHCLKNVKKLVGVDLSAEMLATARFPVRREKISAEEIELLHGNIHQVRFAANSFDFIYSLGMFGFGCPLTIELCNRFYNWLTPGGILFLNVIDFSSLPWRERVRRRLGRAVYARVPAQLGRLLFRREGKIPFYGLRRKELERILQASRFKSYSICSSAWQSDLGKGTHWECLASKPAE